MNGALENCLVLDLSRLLPGPYCSMILADHGARVIAIEDRRFEQDALPVLAGINRNKEHMTLNLKSAKGKEIFFRLVRRADVVMEGFRPGVAARLGVDYASLKAVRPDLIYCSITGYGQNGPLKDLAGHDVNFLGYSGALSLMGPKDGPPCIPGLQLGDLSGGLYAAVGVLMALYAREKTGKGQYIDISMTDTLMAMLPFPAGILNAAGRPPGRGDWLLSHRYACYNVYETRDGKYITLGALEPRFWRNLCDHFGVPEYGPLQFDEDRKGEIITYFQDAFRKKTRAEWAETFKDRDVCLGELLELEEALSSGCAATRHMTETLETADGKTPPMLGTPVKLSETPGSVRTPPPTFGRDTAAILKELGCAPGEIRDMAAEGII
jgi:crotonobetainyl-CoA:carnitine CoA-transferase CaiB-like acyl-CoA transferase